ncbi:Rne/Rng family ribonuclease [Solwaraspora sp. WMMA2080]|uniref:Rne/Rng family ribonuclease n=1 Tax=unclassified Solwaraspora TaxID=2627926 RepID=UPI00248B6838|nr:MULTISPECIES: Rne/Rng family ribonuclease [unclassified Solwaraspora]WBB95433.1 Rne/Rng family ribonuclease [Solwaraspora sp. WMMA2059]WBC20662.1 Rne/Rng family ribonuclease [Solwaraspora sp. WMMA2080]
MLENEPEGGDRTGTEPAGAPADVTRSTTARTTRRRTSKAAAGVAGGDAATTGGSAGPAPATGEPAAVSRTRRRRSTAADKAGTDTTGTDTADAGGPDDTAGPSADSTAEPAIKKTTRTRRKKAAEPAVVVPVEESEPAPGAAAAQLATSSPVGPATPATETPPAAEPVPTRAAGRSAKSESAAMPGPAAADSDAEPGAAVGQAGPATDDAAAVSGVAPSSRRRRAAAGPPVVLFMAPDPQSPPVATDAGQPAAVEPAVQTIDGAEAAGDDEPVRRRRRGRRSADSEPAAEPVTEAAEAPQEQPAEVTTDADTDDDDDDTPAGRRRRRRGRRGRGRGKGGAEEGDADTGDETEASDDGGSADDADGDGDGDSMTRRRRRRRRRGSGDAESGAEDGVPTVVKIREPRKTVDEVQGVTGSTRLEAKRQRRRDGREQRRTRPPILSESEFLARREAVDRDMVVRQRGDRTQIAVLEDGVLVEHYVTRASSGTMAGNVYLGKVQNVLPSMEAAFVDVGRGRNAVLYAGEVNWDATGLEGRSRSIEQALRSGDSVLVQVTKDPIGHKGARLTSHVALSGRHLVYVPNGNASGISRKLPDTERKRLRDILKKLVPDGAGVIVRTAAEGASEDELSRDVKRLQAQWEDIQAKAGSGGAPTLLYEEPDLVIRVVRDLFNEDFRELVVQGDTAYEMVESYLAHVSPDLLARLRRHAAVADVFAERRIDEQILKGLDRKVFLPSGGHLVIDRTEAMTVIDVNTGKYTGAGGNLEETVTRNNLEAAEEIVRQLRLRDIGGIVVIDFIDMVLESNRELVLRRLTECLGRDRTKHQVTEITSLGLVQMTRKRIGAGLLEAFSETCDCCKGRGLIIHTEPVPEKPRSSGGTGAGDRAKTVAAAPASGGGTSVTGGAATGGSRRRGRKANQPADEAFPAPDVTDTPDVTSAPDVTAVTGADQPDEPADVVAGVAEAEAAPTTTGVIRVPVAAAQPLVDPTAEDEDETMGYDLSRYEVDPVVETGNGAAPVRLAGADDPDLADDDDDRDASAGDHAAGGRRRVRRSSGTRRRTRP